MGGDTVLTLIFKAGPVVKFVLLVLLFFSVVSWAIIIYKARLLSKVEKQSDEFQREFIKGKQWDTVYQSTKRLTLSPLANLFRAAYSIEDATNIEIRSTLKRVEAMEATRLEKISDIPCNNRFYFAFHRSLWNSLGHNEFIYRYR